MTFNFLRPGLTVNVEAKVQEQIILDSSAFLPNVNNLFAFYRYSGFTIEEFDPSYKKT